MVDLRQVEIAIGVLLETDAETVKFLDDVIAARGIFEDRRLIDNAVMAIVISLVYCSGVAYPGTTALFSPSMPMQIAPERFTLAFSSRTTFRAGFFCFALSAAIGPAVTRQ